MRFSVIIVSWNALDHLQTFLPSVADTGHPDFEIILADNASDDGSREWVEQHHPSVRVVTFDRNYGYCGGNNRAVPHARGEILVFLNNDVQVEPGWLDKLDACFQKEKDTAALQPKMLSYENPDFFEYAGAAGGFLDRYGYPFCRGRIFDSIEKDEGQYEERSDILWASGAALAIKKSVFEEAGGFDEDFEFHMEEIDLCWRLWNLGYRVQYCPESVVYHLGGGSMPMGSPRKVYYNYRNNLNMIWKNSSSLSLNRRFFRRYLLDVIAAKRAFFTGKWREFWAIIRAHRDFWRGFPATNAKRAELQSKRKIPDDPDTLLPVTLVKEYFIRGNRSFSKLTGQ